MYNYKIVVTGGTFDHFHRGHKAFLQSQLAVSEKVLIGITSDAFISQHKMYGSEPYEKRVAALKDFLSSKHVLDRVEIQKIEDVYIPKVWESYRIEAIVVTKDSQQGAEVINAQRIKEGARPLPFFVVPYVLAQDRQRISSSRIRKGEIDRDGKLFVSPVWFTHTLCLPSVLREEISQPLGTLFESVDALFAEKTIDPLSTISIGDVITDAFVQRKFGQKVAVIDLFVQRKRTYTTIADHRFFGNETIISLANPAGSMTPELFHAVKKSLDEKGKYVLVIDGEEDLAVLPFVLLSPLNFHIVYGQPGRGIVLITVTEKEKQTMRKIVEKFTLLASD